MKADPYLMQVEKHRIGYDVEEEKLARQSSIKKKKDLGNSSVVKNTYLNLSRRISSKGSRPANEKGSKFAVPKAIEVPHPNSFSCYYDRMMNNASIDQHNHIQYSYKEWTSRRMEPKSAMMLRRENLNKMPTYKTLTANQSTRQTLD